MPEVVKGVDEMSDMVLTQEFTDTTTGVRLEVEHDIPEHPRITVFPPEPNTLTLEEFNEAVRRLMTSAKDALPTKEH